MKKNKKMILIFIILIVTIALALIPTFASATINPDDYKPSNPSYTDAIKITNIVNPIIETLKVLGIVIAVIALAVMGIKFMTGSIEEKAEYKKVLPGYFIGVIMVVAITQLLAVVIEIIMDVE